MKIVITNQVAMNAGDAAILHGLLAVLRRAFGESIQIVVLDAHARQVEKLYPTICFRQVYRPGLVRRAARRLLGSWDPLSLLARLREWAARRHPDSAMFEWLLPAIARANLKEMRSADLIISTGGTYLVEHYELEDKFLQLALAVASGRPVVLFTQSLGPFAKRRNIRSLRWLLPRIRLVLLRDELSLAHLGTIGAAAGGEVKVVADAAFALADLEGLKEERDRAGGLQVAVSVRDWTYPGHASPASAARDYKQAVAAMATQLVRRHQARVTFVSTCQGVPDYVYDDSRLAREITASLPQDVARSVVVDGAFHTPDDLMTRLSRFDFVIATRMHMAILALCSGTPVLAIAYEFKTRELFRNMGLDEWVLDIDALTPPAACALVDSLAGSLPITRRKVCEAVSVQHEAAISVAAALARLGLRPAPQQPGLPERAAAAG